MTDRRMIVGLGNPGRDYEGTRHNIGFQVVDALAAKLGVSLKQTKFGAKFADAHFEGQSLLLLKPWQYMNRSGQAVATATGFYKLAPEALWVIIDDMALPPGKIRVRPQGSAGGHNGLADILAKLGTDAVPRCRVGIGQSGRDGSVDFVLGRPGSEERELLHAAVDVALQATLCWLREGTQQAMNEFNGRQINE